MILDKILDGYAKSDDRHPGKGNPSAAAFGKCAAQLQMLRYPEISHPEEFRPRSMMVMEMGKILEDWWARKIDEAFPGMGAFRQELFYFPVPLPESVGLIAIARLEDRLALKVGDPSRIWGTVIDAFVPPSVQGDGTGGEVVHLAPRDRQRPKEPRRLGFILDRAARTLWAPVYVDMILRHPNLGLVVLEKKAVSNFAFRWALMGNLDYEKRCQLAGIAAATDLPVHWLLYRKETAHLLEIAFFPSPERVRISLLRSNGVTEVYYVEPGSKQPMASCPNPDCKGGQVPKGLSENLIVTESCPVCNGRGISAADLPPDQEWEIGEVWTPYDPQILDEIRQRILRVLLFDPYDPRAEPAASRPLLFWREYGPSFICPNCQGTGTQTLRKGSGEPLKKPKPCEDCEKGLLAEAELPRFPCGYCAVVKYCWAPAGVRIEIDQSGPHYYVKREAFEASGLEIHPAAAPEPEADVAQEAE